MLEEQAQGKRRFAFNLIMTCLALAASIAILIITIAKQTTGMTSTSITVSSCSQSYYSYKYSNVSTQLLVVSIFNILGLVLTLITLVLLVVLHQREEAVAFKLSCIKYILIVSNVLTCAVVLGKCATFQLQFNSVATCSIIFDINGVIIVLSCAALMLFSTVLQFVAQVFEINAKMHHNSQQKYFQKAGNQQGALQRHFQNEQTLNNLKLKEEIPFNPTLFNENAMMRFASEKQQPENALQKKEKELKRHEIVDKSDALSEKLADHSSNFKDSEVLEQSIEGSRRNIRRQPFLIHTNSEREHEPVAKLNNYMDYFKYLNASNSQKQTFEDVQDRIKAKYKV